MQIEIGKRYILREDLETKCCGHVLLVGSVLDVEKVMSRQLLVKSGNNFHKVKKGDFQAKAEVCQ